MRDRILIVGRDLALRGRLARLLKGAGHGVELAESAAHALRLGLKGFARAIIAPEGLGPEANRLNLELDKRGIKPLFLGSGLLDPSDENGLLACLEKPAFAADDVPEPALQFGQFSLDLAGHTLTDESGNDIPLTRGEFNLLRELAQKPGRVLSRDQLLSTLAGRDAESFDRSIDMLVMRLRRKIETDPKRPSLIVTVPGTGYKFAARVRELTRAAPGETESQAERPTPQVNSPAAPERRQLTILQCELSGPAFVSAQRDPEELQRLLAAFHEHCAQLIVQAGGTMGRLLTDGALAYFGYPRADEHQAERAVRAGLHLIETAERIETGHTDRLHVRVGIASGLVVVAGFGPSGEPLALGEAATRAAGLVSRAEANTVLISGRMRRLVGDLFHYRQHAPLMFDGAAEPLETWTVAGVSASESRFESIRAGHLTQFVGRQAELGLLMDRWKLAQSGEGQVVLLCGEPGIGKSRILKELREHLESEHVTSMRLQCSPYYSNSAFYPIIDNFERAVKFGRDDTPEAKLDKLEALVVGNYGLPRADVRFIAAILSIPCETRYGAVTMSPQKFKAETLRTLVDILEAAARQQPTVVLFEDAHWADPSTLEALDLLVGRLTHISLLIVITHRPEFRSRWSQYNHVTALTVTKLTQTQSGILVSDLTNGKALPPELLEQVVLKTDGVPLFIEELTKAVLESGLLVEDRESYVLTGTLPGLTIPATLHDSLMARLDRLSQAREIAQIGAALGRVFSYEVLREVATLPHQVLQSALGDLVRSELVFCRGVPPQAVYTFKHALVQDAAYQTMLKSRRIQLHARIADVLQSSFPDLMQTEPETLARHFTAAALPEKAIPYWLAAGKRSQQSCAHREAIAHLNAGIALLSELPDAASRTKFEVKLRAALGFVLVVTKGYAAPEVEAEFSRAHELCQMIGDTSLTIPVLRAFTTLHWDRGNLYTARSSGLNLVEIAQRTSDAELSLVAHGILGGILNLMGEIAASEDHLAKLRVPYDHQQRRNIVARFGVDTPSTTWVVHAWNLAWLGHFDASFAAVNDAVACARRTGHPYSVAHALRRAAVCAIILRDPARAASFIEERILAAREPGNPDLATDKVVLGWVSALTGKPEEGIDRIHDGIALWRSTGAVCTLPLAFCLLSEAMLVGGDIDGAIAAADEGRRWSVKNSERAWDCLLHCSRGDALLAASEATEAEVDYQQALAWSRERSTILGELYAGIRLARLWRSRGRIGQARKLLIPIYASFTEGFETKHLQEAKALLKELAN